MKTRPPQFSLKQKITIELEGYGPQFQRALDAIYKDMDSKNNNYKVIQIGNIPVFVTKVSPLGVQGKKADITVELETFDSKYDALSIISEINNEC